MGSFVLKLKRGERDYCSNLRASTFGITSSLFAEQRIISVRTNLQGTLSQNLSHSDHQSLFTLQDFSQWQYAFQIDKVRNRMKNLGGDLFNELTMIDALQRLIIDHHFRHEIRTALKRQYVWHSSLYKEYGNHELMESALRFRLLRQDGYTIDADLFNNFKGRDGRFMMEKLNHKNTAELLSLFEASQLSMRGEDVLDEANEFCRQLLTDSMKNFSLHESKYIGHTLKYPYHKTSGNFLAKDFLQNLDVKQDWMKDVRDLANMEYVMVRRRLQNEILQVSNWWKDLGLSKELAFARDQPLKWYMWPLASLPDPVLSEQRMELVKPISMIYIIDDIYDVYGTLDEVSLFTKAINRRDVSTIEQLPDYMKICYKALLDITDEVSWRVYLKCGWNPVDSLWKAWADLCNAFLVEARWFASGQLPSAEEYLNNGIVSSGTHIVLIHLFFLLGEGINKDTVEHLNKNHPSIATATILRLWDDLGSAKDEKQDGYDGSYIECYMNEHQGISFEDSQVHVATMISDAWKCLNEECLLPSSFSLTFRKACLNLARMVPLMYNYDDSGHLTSLEQYMKSLLC